MPVHQACTAAGLSTAAHRNTVVHVWCLSSLATATSQVHFLVLRRLQQLPQQHPQHQLLLQLQGLIDPLAGRVCDSLINAQQQLPPAPAAPSMVLMMGMLAWCWCTARCGFSSRACLQWAKSPQSCVRKHCCQRQRAPLQ